MKAYELRLTAGAVRDLNEIYTYIAATQSEQDAEYVFERILDVVTGLQTYPNRGACPAELSVLGSYEYREVFFQPYRIIYSIERTRVYVQLIADGRRNFRALLAQRLLG